MQYRVVLHDNTYYGDPVKQIESFMKLFKVVDIVNEKQI